MEEYNTLEEKTKLQAGLNRATGTLPSRDTHTPFTLGTLEENDSQNELMQQLIRYQMYAVIRMCCAFCSVAPKVPLVMY